MRAIAARHKLQLVGCAWFWAYALVGAALVLGGLSLGPLLFIPTAIAMWLLARRHAINGFGMLCGGGVVLLVIAYLQRQGPGTTCWHTATAAGCDQHLNPLPFLAVGLLCLVGGVVGHARRSR